MLCKYYKTITNESAYKCVHFLFSFELLLNLDKKIFLQEYFCGKIVL